MSVYRCYSVKKPGFDVEAQGLCRQLREQLGILGQNYGVVISCQHEEIFQYMHRI